MLGWIIVDEMYLDYLRNNVDHRIPYVDYGDDKCKPFFGVLFETDKYAYVTQVSHPRQRHYKLRSRLDFVKVYEGEKLLCVVNLNYMFPIPKKKIRYFSYNYIQSYRSFSSDKEKDDYIALLKKELYIMRTMHMEQRARKLYNLYHTHNDSSIAKRCLDFQSLEKACVAYYEQE